MHTPHTHAHTHAHTAYTQHTHIYHACPSHPYPTPHRQHALILALCSLFVLWSEHTRSWARHTQHCRPPLTITTILLTTQHDLSLLLVVGFPGSVRGSDTESRGYPRKRACPPGGGPRPHPVALPSSPACACGPCSPRVLLSCDTPSARPRPRVPACFIRRSSPSLGEGLVSPGCLTGSSRPFCTSQRTH